MLTLLALVSAAFAGDDALADEIRALQAELGGPVLLCVAGEAAEQATRRTLRDIGHEDLPITRVPTMGDVDAEMARALADSPVACALRIAPGDAGFAMRRFGVCAAGGGAPGTEPDEAAIGGADVPAAPTAGAAPGPPAPAGEPAPAPLTEGEWEAREARFKLDRLTLNDLPPSPTLPDDVSWEIVDGRGSSLSARSLATLAKADDIGRELDLELARSQRASKAMLWTGIGLALLSPAPLLGVEDGAISTNQDRAWSTVFLLATGALTASLSRAPRDAARARQLHPALYMDGDMAEDVVAVHNLNLHRGLELDRRPPPPEDAPDAGETPDAGDDAEGAAVGGEGAPSDR